MRLSLFYRKRKGKTTFFFHTGVIFSPTRTRPTFRLPFLSGYGIMGGNDFEKIPDFCDVSRRASYYQGEE